jgi:hypothetical protein
MDSGVTPKFCEYSGDDLLGWVIARNVDRRSLTAGQRAALASDLANWDEGRNQFTEGAPDQGVSRKVAAHITGASERGVELFRTIENRDPDLANAVRTGKQTLQSAYTLVKKDPPSSGLDSAPTPIIKPVTEQEFEPGPVVEDEPEERVEAIPPSLLDTGPTGSADREFEERDAKVQYKAWYEVETGKICVRMGGEGDVHELRPDTAQNLVESLLNALRENIR